MTDHDATESELEAIREPHQDWCAEHGVDPTSPLGMEAAIMMVEGLRKGIENRDSLVALCDSFEQERQTHVRLGAPAIPSLPDEQL